MEESLKWIAEAEARAEEIKAEAYKKAEALAAEAEARALSIEKQSETALKEKRERAIGTAEEKALEDYRKAIELRSGEARRYADGILQNTDAQVKKITGRICGDR